MEGTTASLVSSKPSESGLHVLLHPLVPLNISDHVTRHAVRQQSGPIVGAILGQQQGRNISLEHAFECKVDPSDEEGAKLDLAWFDVRLKQFKDVHKSPALDLVGWFAITPPSGPTAAQLPIHRQILENYNETAVLLAFHASDLENMSSAVGKLPLTIFESTYEGDNVENNDDKSSMQIDGQQPKLGLKFRELPHSIETGEAEMIAVDFVASGAGNAAAIPAGTESTTEKDAAAGKGKGKEVQGESASATDTSPLSREDEDLIANLNTRLSAVKVLQSRLHILQAYLTQISQPADSTSDADPSTRPQPSHALLRSIYSLVSQLSLINPQPTDNFSAESLAQANDVAMVSVLGAMGESVQQVQELGRKFGVISYARRRAASRDPHAMLRSGMSEEAFLSQRGLT